MAKETNIDSMKYRKSTHLAGIDIETIIADKGNCILTIKEAFYDTGVDVSGNKTSGYFIEFVEDVKPMVVNSTNRKIIGNIVKDLKNITNTESRNIGNWIGVKIELLFDPTIKMMGKVVGGIRVNGSDRANTRKPVLELGTDNFNSCRASYLASKDQVKLLAKIKDKYEVSQDVEQKLTEKNG